MSRILGLINARAGSKGIPGKNIKNFAGKPLIAWSIEAAKRCSLIDLVIVSTDDEEIASIAREYGAQTPFIRPASLSTDNALQIDVIIHAVQWLEDQKNDFYDVVCLLQPTNPVRVPEDITGTLELLLDTHADCAITITPVGGYHPQIYYHLNEDHKVDPFMPAPSEGVARQSFSNLYRRVGSVYAMKRENLNLRTLYGNDVRGYEVPFERSINIDEDVDWDIAEMFARKQMEKVKV